MTTTTAHTDGKWYAQSTDEVASALEVDVADGALFVLWEAGKFVARRRHPTTGPPQAQA